jgi:hypothetical protein
VPFIAVHFLPRRTAKSVFLPGAQQRGSHTVWFRRRQLLLFVVHREKRTTKIIYRALSDVAHGKDALPCKMPLYLQPYGNFAVFILNKETKLCLRAICSAEEFK